MNRVFGSEDEFMKRYQNFNNVYKMSLAKELDSTAISAGQRRMIQAAMDSPVINLNLIRNVKERQNLTSMLRNNVLDIESMVRNFGAPGVGMPSSNLYRGAARYLVDQKNSNHPVLSLINSLTFNIDKTKAGADAFNIGKSNLPSFAALKNASEQSKSISSGGGIFSRVTPTKPVKILTFDVETSGLGVYDQVRSLAASTMEVQHGGVVRHTADGMSTHFITPQMEQYTVRGVSGRTTRLGTGVYQMESKSGDTVADLTTAQGRKEAASIYKKFFKQATEADMIAGYNVQFDIQRIMMSISGLDEFYQDKEAVELMQKFQKMTEQGKVVNTLDLARDYLTRQAVGIAELAGPDEAIKTQRLISAMFAPETLSRASIGGSATPFSIGNIAGQTNLLELIQSKGGTVGADIIKTLSEGGSAAHQANVDTILTNFMMQFIHTNELQYGFDSTGTATDAVSAARKTILKSSAIVPTTNIANVQHMSDAVYKFALSEEGMKATKLTTENGILSFSKADNQFYENITDKMTGEVSQVKVGRTDAFTRIQDALEASRRGDDSELLETGINYLQASRTDRILQNVARTSGLSTATTSKSLIAAISGGKDLATEEKFIDALAGTREFLGFNDYQYRPDILADKGITNLISKSYGNISEFAAENYVKKLAAGGIANAIDDPYMRRNFVELATITSSTPFSGRAEGETGGLAGKLVRRISSRASGTGPITASEHAARVAEFNSNVGVKVGEYLSEIGVSFADAQTSNYLINKSGQISRPVISADILKNIDVSISDKSTGAKRTVKFLSEDFLSDYGMNKFGLSVTDREEGRMVNLVFGNLAADSSSTQRVVSRRTAVELASGIVDQMQAKYSGLTAKQLVEQGAFENERQAGDVLSRLRKKGGALGLKKEIARSISDRGLAVGSIQGREAEGVVALLEQIAGGIDNDTEAYRKGMQFAMNEYGDDFIAFQGRVDDKVVEALRASNPALAAQIEDGTFLKNAYDTYQTTMVRAGEDTGFRKRIQRAFSSKGLDKGIGGTRIGRGLRDEAVRTAYRKYAPKVGIGVAAVGLLSAGYYIAKKNREKNLYDEVMQEQPLEGRGTVSDTNRQIVSDYPQQSTRRDPLVTAGVVGNLDRNKIGHTGMGPKKYDHLYR